MVRSRTVANQGPQLLVAMGTEQAQCEEAHLLDMPSSRIPRQELRRRYGRVYGYPETAIEGYLQGETLRDTSVLASELSFGEMQVFKITRPFMLSLDHWRDEAAVLHEWITALIRAAPMTTAFLSHMDRSC